MPSISVQPVSLLKLDDWSRLYQFDFADSFVEFKAPTPPTITGTPTVTADPGITVGSPTVNGGVVTVRISGGTTGESYNASVAVVLSTGDELSIPASSTSSLPGRAASRSRRSASCPVGSGTTCFPSAKSSPNSTARPRQLSRERQRLAACPLLTAARSAARRSSREHPW
jgi:hypothetical protein